MFLKMRIRIERSNGREKSIIRSRFGKKKGGFSLLRMVWKIIKGENGMYKS